MPKPRNRNCNAPRHRGKNEEDVTTEVIDGLLKRASEDGQEMSIEVLLGKEELINRRSSDGTTFLLFAVQKRWVKLLTKLLEAGADPTLSNKEGVNPIKAAIINQDFPSVNVLMSSWNDNSQSEREMLDERGYNPLMLALEREWKLGIDNFIPFSNVNQASKDGVDSMMIAAKNGNLHAVELLDNYDADFLRECKMRMTAVCLSIVHNRIHVRNFFFFKMDDRMKFSYIKSRISLLIDKNDDIDVEFLRNSVFFIIFDIKKNMEDGINILQKCRIFDNLVLCAQRYLLKTDFLQKLFQFMACLLYDKADFSVYIDCKLAECFITSAGPQFLTMILNSDETTLAVKCAALLPIHVLGEIEAGRDFILENANLLFTHMKEFDNNNHQKDYWVQGQSIKVPILFNRFKEAFLSITCIDIDGDGTHIMKKCRDQKGLLLRNQEQVGKLANIEKSSSSMAQLLDHGAGEEIIPIIGHKKKVVKKQKKRMKRKKRKTIQGKELNRLINSKKEMLELSKEDEPTKGSDVLDASDALQEPNAVIIPEVIPSKDNVDIASTASTTLLDTEEIKATLLYEPSILHPADFMLYLMCGMIRLATKELPVPSPLQSSYQMIFTGQTILNRPQSKSSDLKIDESLNDEIPISNYFEQRVGMFLFSERHLLARKKMKETFRGISIEGRKVFIKKVLNPILSKKHILNIKHILLGVKVSDNILSFSEVRFMKKSLYLITYWSTYTLEEFLFVTNLKELSEISKSLVLQLLKGLDHLHNREIPILHGHLKPSNIMIDNQRKLLISDFGLIGLFPPRNGIIRVNASDDVIWRPQECLSAHNREHVLKIYTTASDICVAGMLAHYILTGGKHPFGDDSHECQLNISKNNSHIELSDIDGADLIRFMTAFEPLKRPSARISSRHPVFLAPEEKVRLIATAMKQPEFKHLFGLQPSRERLPNDLKKGVSTNKAAKLHPVILSYMQKGSPLPKTPVDLLTSMLSCFASFDEMESTRQKKRKTPAIYYIGRYQLLVLAAYHVIGQSNWMNRTIFAEFYPSTEYQVYR